MPSDSSRWRIVLTLLLTLCAREQALAGTFNFSSPPMLGVRESRSLFSPLTDLLTRETGETFIYVHPESWFAYQRGMREGRFDLLLDDAHFASWRIASRGHVPLAYIGGRIRFVTITTRTGRVYSKEDLVGRPVCAHAPPELGTVAFMRHFKGPFRLPRVLPTSNPLDRVHRLLTGQCVAAVLVRYHYTDTDEVRRMADNLKIIAQSDSYPGLTLTAGGDLPGGLATAIRTILLSGPGRRATQPLRDRLANGGEFEEAAPDDYQGLDKLIRDYPGFGD